MDYYLNEYLDKIDRAELADYWGEPFPISVGGAEIVEDEQVCEEIGG